MGPRSTKRTRGNALILLTIFCSSIIVPAVGSTDGYWVAKAPAPEPIGGQPGHVAELNGKIYAVTSGQNLWKYDPTTNNWTAQTRSEYDPINKTWEEKPSLPKAVDVYEVAACAGKLYVFGARNSGTTSYNVIEIYNPVTSIWQVEIESLPINLYVQPIVVNDKIYIIGGTHQAGFAVIVYDKTNQVYDTKTGTWTTMAALPMGVANYASAVLDNKIYLFGGTNNSWPGRQYVVSQYTNVVQIYDVVNDSWTFGAPVSTEMCSMAAAAIPGTSGTTQIYLAGGRYTEYLGNEGAVLGFPPVNTTQIYDPATNTWTTGPQMLTARSGLSLINVNNKVVCFGRNKR
jgi:N-acetylneuraminic acid mutarotase